MIESCLNIYLVTSHPYIKERSKHYNYEMVHSIKKKTNHKDTPESYKLSHIKMQGDDQSNKYSFAQNKLKLKAEKTTPIHTFSSSSCLILSASGNHSCKQIMMIVFGLREETTFPSDTAIYVQISK